MKIHTMPTKELLEDFLKGMSSKVTVIFDINKGEFVRVAQRNHSKLERPLPSTHNQVTT